MDQNWPATADTSTRNTDKGSRCCGVAGFLILSVVCLWPFIVVIPGAASPLLAGQQEDLKRPLVVLALAASPVSLLHKCGR